MVAVVDFLSAKFDRLSWCKLQISIANTCRALANIPVGHYFFHFVHGGATGQLVA